MFSMDGYAPFLHHYWFIILPVVAFVAGYIILSKTKPGNTIVKPSSVTVPIPKGHIHHEGNHVFMDKTDESEDHHFMPDTQQSHPHIPYTPVVFSEDQMVQRSKEFYHLMNKRRTVRFFSDKPVSRDIIDNIIHTAGTSPSGAHTEPWTFVVVSDEGVKARIKEIIEYEEYLNYEKRMGEAWVHDIEMMKTCWEKPYLETAPHLIVLFRKTYGHWPNGEKRTHYYGEMSACIATGILLCAIQNAGLVTLTSTPMNAGPQLRRLLKRPVEEKVLLLLPVGYATDDVTVPDLHRKPLDEILVHVG